MSFSNEQLNRFEIRAAKGSMLAPTAAHAMLSLNEVLCCESSVMKAWLNCLESARTSAAAASGAIGIARIFDVSMVGGDGEGDGRREADRSLQPREGSRKEGSPACPKGAFARIVLRAAPRSQRYPRISLDMSRS